MLKKKILISVSIFALLLIAISGYLLIRAPKEKDGEYSNAKLVFNERYGQNQ